MKQDVLVSDILPYIEMWSFTIFLVLMIYTYHIWRFEKKHPEISKPETPSDTPELRQQKTEFRCQYNNKSLRALSMVFVWMVGMVAICYWFDPSTLSPQGYFLIAFGILGILLLILSKPRKH